MELSTTLNPSIPPCALYNEKRQYLQFGDLNERCITQALFVPMMDMGVAPINNNEKPTHLVKDRAYRKKYTV